MKSVRIWQVVSAILLVALVMARITAIIQDQTASAAQARLDCAAPSLQERSRDETPECLNDQRQ